MNLYDLERRWRGHVPVPLGMEGNNALLVPLVERPEGLSLLFQVRSDTLRSQPGEVCFPGGRMEPGETPEAAALRETWEELGIPPKAVRVIAPLDYLIMDGRFATYPVLAKVAAVAAGSMTLSKAEVKAAFFVPVEYFIKNPPQVFRWDLVPDVPEDFPYEIIGFPDGYRWRRGRSEVPVYHWQDKVIWGMTGRVVRALLGQ